MLLFTTASSALVTPYLIYGSWKDTVLYSLVDVTFANSMCLAERCQTPITRSLDPLYKSSSSLESNFMQLGLHDLDSYLQDWSKIALAGLGASLDLAHRPQVLTTSLPGVDIKGSWVALNYSDLSANYKKFHRIVNNVTIFMPHPSVYLAYQDTARERPQLISELAVGACAIQASVVSPTTNVLCVNLNKTELEPIVYTAWPHAQYSNETARVPGQQLPWEDW